MYNRAFRFLALMLTAAVLLSGCRFWKRMDLGYGSSTHYDDMEYTRPDMSEHDQILMDSCSTIGSTGSLDSVIDAIYDYYDVYDRFYTNMNLADIRYSGDLTDTYWEAEYNYCLENSAAVDAGLEELYRALAACKFRDELETDEYFGADYFDYYDGESVYDPQFLSFLEQEAQLQSRYYELCNAAAAAEYYSEEYFTGYAMPMAELFVELVKVRQVMAAYAGYESYPEFAYDFYYYRDYTPAEAEDYVIRLGEALYGQYCAVNQSDVWDLVYGYCSEADTFGYVKEAARAMGGDIEAAFELLDEAGLYDIRYSENKYDSSFEVFLSSYYEPFIFMCPYLDQTDKLTFAHEFGHFVNDYVCGGSYAGTDVAEVHSQAMEYLSLCFCEDTADLTKYKMADSLCTYMEQAAYALFELQVYDLVGDDLTAENVLALYESIGYQFGFDSWAWDSRDFVTITHFYTNPMYVIGYVVSNDLAMQIYQLEVKKDDAGLALYNECLYSEESYIIYFAETYGLESPFAEGRPEAIAATFADVFGRIC